MIFHVLFTTIHINYLGSCRRSVFLRKEKQGRKIGWFGWSFITVITLTLIGSIIFFFNIFHLDVLAIIGDKHSSVEQKSKTKERIPDQTIEHVEKIQKTIGKEYEELGDFIAITHEFYNETTGYGGIGSLDWHAQVEKAEEIKEIITELLPTVKVEALRTDLEHIVNLTDQLIKNEKEADARNLHRMFHDLDIALNSYNGYDKIWNVTETLKRTDETE